MTRQTWEHSIQSSTRYIFKDDGSEALRGNYKCSCDEAQKIKLQSFSKNQGLVEIGFFFEPPIDRLVRETNQTPTLFSGKFCISLISQ